MENSNKQGILKVLNTKEFEELYEKVKGNVALPSPHSVFPSFRIRNISGAGIVNSFLYNFPGKTNIAILSNVQNYNLIGLKEVISVSEKILKIAGMFSLVLTTNSGFSYENEIIELGFEKILSSMNPHSANKINFFVKEM